MQDFLGSEMEHFISCIGGFSTEPPGSLNIIYVQSYHFGVWPEWALCSVFVFLYMSRVYWRRHHLEENTAEKLPACNGNKRGGKMGQNANKLISHWEALGFMFKSLRDCVTPKQEHSVIVLLLSVFADCSCCCLSPQFSHRSQVAHLSCVACLPCFSTEWSCNCTEMRPTKFQRSNDNENDHKCLFIYWQARGNNSSGFVWRSQVWKSDF